MQYNFLNIFLEKGEQDIKLKQEEMSNSSGKILPEINHFLLENSKTQLEQCYEFFKQDKNLLYINGFIGTGKAQIVNRSLCFLSPETIVLKYNCFDSTMLDDILLTFFNDFKKLSAQKIISEPKSKSENFSQKINSYFAHIEKPFVIIIDSFESILAENRQEILDFLIHLSSLEKIKTIIISRTYEEKFFENSPIKIDRITTHALEKSVFEKYLKTEKVKYNGVMIDELYKYSRGYFFYTALSINIIKQKKYSLFDFVKAFKESFLTFDEFLAKQSLELIPATTRNLFWFLAMIRHGVTEDLLKLLDLYDEEKIGFLTDNMILLKDNKLVYVQDYFKEKVDISIAPNIAQKIHQLIVNIYQTQLPLKPLERNILLSRQSMRKEIEYHNLFLPKKPKNLENKDLDISYLTYSKVFDFELQKTEKKEEEEQVSKLLESKIQGDVARAKNINLDLKTLANQEKPAEKTFKQIDSSSNSSSNIFLEAAEEEKLSFKEIIMQAQIAEKNYEYLKAIELYKKALERDGDENYNNNLARIYSSLALIYQKNADYENAIQYFVLAESIYRKNGENSKSNYLKLNRAKILTETYKLEKAKELLIEILNSAENSSVVKTKTYLQLANIEDNFSNINESFSLYKKACETADYKVDVETLSEIYFKYALALDDKNDSIGAIEYYKKCIELSTDSNRNKFISPSYTNIASLYLEKNEIEQAEDAYMKAFELDRKNENNEGMYYSASKLATVLRKKEPQKALKYYNVALESAKNINDIFYIASTSLAIGDFHYDRKENEMALKYYVETLELVQDKFSKENIDKIKIRINDIKFRIGESRFEQTMKIIGEVK